MKAEAVMTRDVVCVTAQDSLQDAREIMTEWEVRHLPVLADKKVVGMLSDRDVLLYASRNGDILAVPRVVVTQVMTADPVICTADTPLADVGRLMLKHRIDSVPVVNEGYELIGLITSTDLIAALVRHESAPIAAEPTFNYDVYEKTRLSAGEAGGERLRQ
jgi:CBS domain-containing membrane protein/CBS domain-containing protein